jgi:hypothetical protein
MTVRSMNFWVVTPRSQETTPEKSLRNLVRVGVERNPGKTNRFRREEVRCNPLAADFVWKR